MEDKKYYILDRINKINNKHTELKDSILSQLLLIEKIEKDIINNENELLELEKEYVELVSELDNIVNG